MPKIYNNLIQLKTKTSNKKRMKRMKKNINLNFLIQIFKAKMVLMRLWT